MCDFEMKVVPCHRYNVPCYNCTFSRYKCENRNIGIWAFISSVCVFEMTNEINVVEGYCLPSLKEKSVLMIHVPCSISSY